MHCGVDEAGRGSVMGPLVVGAVFVDSDEPLTSIGVKDSKKLTPKRREAMYDEITAVAQWTVVIASAADVDARRKEMSLNDVELNMFAEACSVRRASTVYADCPDVNEASLAHRLGALVPHAEIIAKHKADDIRPHTRPRPCRHFPRHTLGASRADFRWTSTRPPSRRRARGAYRFPYARGEPS